MRKLARFLKKYRLQVILGPVFKLTEAIFELIVPIVTAQIIDNGVRTGDVNYVWRMGGVMLLFLAVTAMHFLSGGFLPLVFLPTTFRAAAPFLPTYVLMEGMKLVVTSSFSLAVFIKLAVLAMAGFLLSVGAEVVRE